jgi:hypothetical protein
MLSVIGRLCVFCKMDLLTKTTVWSEVASDFHTEPEGEGSICFPTMLVTFTAAT